LFILTNQGKNIYFTMILNKCSVIIFATFLSQSLSAQSFFALDSSRIIELKNPSFDGEKGASKLPNSWIACDNGNELLPDIQPGSFGVRLPPFQGKTYMSLVANDNGTTESFRQNLPVVLKAGNCYRFSLYLAKSESYINQSLVNGEMTSFTKPLKLEIYGLKNDSCNLNDETWLVETKAVHHDGWKKYIFNMQFTYDCKALVFRANHADLKPYNGNILIDNVSTIRLIECEDYKIGSPNSRFKTTLLLDFLNETIVNNGNQMQFGKRKTTLVSDGYNSGEGIVRNAYFDRMLEVFEKFKDYKLLIRVKSNGKYTKRRVAFLYNYVFKFTKLKANQVDIQPYKTKDEAFIWSVENDELAITFDTM
jgi:hypothetical protein